MSAGHDDAVIGVQVDLVDGDGRESAAEREPCLAAVVGHERTDVGRGVKGVGIRGIDGDRVDRVVRQVAADVVPRSACVGRLEDVTGLVRSRRVVAVESDVGDTVVAAVDRDPRHRPLGKLRVRNEAVSRLPVAAAAVAREAESCPRRRVARQSVGAEVNKAVFGAGVGAVAPTNSDRGDDTGARAVWRCTGTAACQVPADRRELDVAGARRLGVVGAVKAEGGGEQLVGIQLVQRDRDVEVRAFVRVDPVEDELVAESAPAVREPV